MPSGTNNTAILAIRQTERNTFQLESLASVYSAVRLTFRDAAVYQRRLLHGPRPEPVRIGSVRVARVRSESNCIITH